MSMFGDYKAYKKYEPIYPQWKSERNLAEAKRIDYIKKHPDKITPEDIQRGKTLLRSIDIMDEYSQKRAEDMEAITNTIVAYGIEFAILIGSAIGFALTRLKPVKDLLSKFLKSPKNSKNSTLVTTIFTMGIGATLATVAGFPLYAWAAKTEVGASKKGRFEAMRKELKNPKCFAILTPEQMQEAQEIAIKIQLPEENKNIVSGLSKSFQNIKKLAVKDKEYQKQRKLFDLELANDNIHINDQMSEDEILKAKQDQQLLSKIVEKIDIASQDYAENAELAGETLVTGLMAGTVFVDMGLKKLLQMFKVKSQQKISLAVKGSGLTLSLLSTILLANISKEASRIGRFKIKKELIQHPEQLVYVDDQEIADIQDVKPLETKKTNILEFLKNVYKDAKEYKQYKKNGLQNEKKFYQAIEQLQLTPEQMKDAQRLQKNTFRTFNKVDEKSQKYSESIEALGNAVAQPLVLISTLIGVAFAIPYLTKEAKTPIQRAENITKYVFTILLSSLPSVIINAIITKQQKKASRIADMLAINEMQDYRQFR